MIKRTNIYITEDDRFNYEVYKHRWPNRAGKALLYSAEVLNHLDDTWPDAIIEIDNIKYKIIQIKLYQFSHFSPRFFVDLLNEENNLHYLGEYVLKKFHLITNKHDLKWSFSILNLKDKSLNYFNNKITISD